MTPAAPAIPPRLQQILRRFAVLGREDKMAALLSYARRLEPLPPRFAAVSDEAFAVPECQTPVRLFPELREGRLHFHADIDARQSPTVAAFLALVFGAVNGDPPATTLAIPGDFVQRVMSSLGLGTREVGLEAIVARLKRHAREALEGHAPTGQDATPATPRTAGDRGSA